MTEQKSVRIAAIDWMRGLVMVLMVIDHAGMAFDGAHLSSDSVGLYQAGTLLPAWPFFSRWMTHLCAPTFVFLAGTALALSVERRVKRGEDPRVTDRGILTRGAIIALLDPTIISLASGRLTLQVLFAIGVAMMAMAPLRRLPTGLLVGAALAWMVAGEAITDPLWVQEHGWPAPWVAALFAALFEPALKIAYPVLPWLSMMMLGWAFGRYLVGRLAEGDTRGPTRTLLLWGTAGLAVFGLVRWLNGYGNMFLLRGDDSWVQWLHVSKYPPSLGFSALELGLLGVLLAAMIVLERWIGVRQKGPLLVFGQTAMFYYLAHRLVFEGLATWLGLRGSLGLEESYAITAVSLVVLYPACLWYRDLKRRHPQSALRYF
ncbi:MAG: DUF1624 domain-containing protein [Myxococcota bacterium]